MTQRNRWGTYKIWIKSMSTESRLVDRLLKNFWHFRDCESLHKKFELVQVLRCFFQTQSCCPCFLMQSGSGGGGLSVTGWPSNDWYSWPWCNFASDSRGACWIIRKWPLAERNKPDLCRYCHCFMINQWRHTLPFARVKSDRRRRKEIGHGWFPKVIISSPQCGCFGCSGGWAPCRARSREQPSGRPGSWSLRSAPALRTSPSGCSRTPWKRGHLWIHVRGALESNISFSLL